MTFKVISLIALALCHARHALADVRAVAQLGNSMSKAFVPTVQMPRLSGSVLVNPAAAAALENAEVVARSGFPVHQAPWTKQQFDSTFHMGEALKEQEEEQKEVYQHLRSRMQKMPQADVKDAQYEFGFGSMMGLMASVGLVAAIGFAAARKYFAHGQHVLHSTVDSQISFPQRSRPIVAMIRDAESFAVADLQNQETPEFAAVSCPVVPPQPLAPLAEEAAHLLTKRNDTVTVFDATAGGLIQAALLARPGASKYVTCAANTISTRRSAQFLGEPLVAKLSASRPTDGSSYKESKKFATVAIAREMRAAIGATWCIAESGACGPTFNFPGVDAGFTAICVSGPVERAVLVESNHVDREANMWGFTKVALDLLAECLQAASTVSPNQSLVREAFEYKVDRFDGVNVEVPCSSAAHVAEFTTQLRSCLAEWTETGKRGIWFKVPVDCARFVAPLTAEGFKFHHAQDDYVMLTRWLANGPSKLPRFGFTQVGVGGAVVNSKDEVLMIQERRQANPKLQGLWKLPGGLADSGEDLATTAGREVLEETGIATELIGVVSMRHQHGVRFGQSDMYFVVKLRAATEEIKIDSQEIANAKWMSLDEISKLVPTEKKDNMVGCVSASTFKVIQEALTGSLIDGTMIPNTRGGSNMMYTAAAIEAPRNS